MKSVLITGASKGIGKALAYAFLKEGHHVVCTSRVTKDLASIRKNYPKSCGTFDLDLQSASSIKALLDNISHIQFDFIVQNAGALANNPFAEITKSDLYRCYEVNVLGPFQLQQGLMSLLKPNAHTVFISSVGGFQGSVKFPGLSAYSTSKAAIVSLTELLQEEFKDTDLAFNCLCLGAVQTEMLENAFPGYQAPLNPEQMAAYIYQFTTTAHHFMRGKILPVTLSTP